MPGPPLLFSWAIDTEPWQAEAFQGRQWKLPLWGSQASPGAWTQGAGAPSVGSHDRHQSWAEDSCGVFGPL